MEFRRQKTLLKTGALQDALFNSARFSSIATDEKGVIQIFNVGAERMLKYAALDVVNQITPADISDPQELSTRAAALSLELDTPITPHQQPGAFAEAQGGSGGRRNRGAIAPAPVAELRRNAGLYI